jgi:hypothetical protein
VIPITCGVKRVFPAFRSGENKKPPHEALARPPRAASLPIGPSLDPQRGMRRPASPTTFQALCQIVKIRIFRSGIKSMDEKIQFLTKCFQIVFLPISISRREFIVQRKK